MSDGNNSSVINKNRSGIVLKESITVCLYEADGTVVS